MTYISPELYQRIQEHPEGQYAVLITLKGEGLPRELENRGRFIMADTILSATLSGQEIRDLVNRKGIEAIESDVEMHTM